MRSRKLFKVICPSIVALFLVLLMIVSNQKKIRIPSVKSEYQIGLVLNSNDLKDSCVRIIAKSVDGEHSAFITESNNDQEQNIMFIKNLGDNSTAEIKIEGFNSNDIMKIEWVTDSRVGVLFHMNPSLSAYRVYDIYDEQTFDEYFGLGFNWNDDGTYMVYTVPSPHYAKNNGHTEVLKDNKDEIIYTAEKEKTLSSQSAVFGNKEKVVFFETDRESNQTNLVCLGFTKENGAIQTKKLIWDEIIGEIKFKNSSCVIIENHNERLVYDLEKEEIKKIGKSKR